LSLSVACASSSRKSLGNRIMEIYHHQFPSIIFCETAATAPGSTWRHTKARAQQDSQAILQGLKGGLDEGQIRTGREGEAIAARYLEQKEIPDRRAELPLCLRRNGYHRAGREDLFFVEVKSRKIRTLR